MAATQSAEVRPAVKPLSRRIMVKVRRDQTTDTPRPVWAHEFPILEAIFGSGNVMEVDPETLDEHFAAKPSADLMPFNKVQDKFTKPSTNAHIGWVFTGNAEDEYGRLERAYGRHVEVPVPNVEHVYGRYARGDFKRMLGTPQLSDLPADQLRDIALNYGHALPVAVFDSTPQERKEAAEAWATFRALPQADLVKLCEALGVQLG